MAGVDLKQGAWCVAELKYEGFEFREVEKVQDIPENSLIDLPIGLPKDGKRRCDTRAKKLLGERHATVFLTPTRKAIYSENYEEANHRNREQAGFGVSKQVWNLVPKIREIDGAVRSGRTLKESHPEVVFAKLAGEPLPSKHSEEGLRRRVQILSRYDKDIEEKAAGIHDRLDAAVLSLHQTIRFKPVSPPEKDSKNIPMQIRAPV